MLIILYLKMVITLVFVVPALVTDNVPDDFTTDMLRVFITFVSLEFLFALLMVMMVRKRSKYFLVMLPAFGMLITKSSDLQMMATLLIILLFFLRSTREYFQNKPLLADDKDEPIEVSTTVAEAADASAGDAQTGGGAEAPTKPAAIEKPKTKAKTDLEVTIRPAVPEDADTIHTLMMLSFEEYRQTVPPSSALDETSEGILEALREGNESAAILYEDDAAVAMVRYKFEGDAIIFFRLSVIPSKRRRGYAKKLVKWVELQGTTKGMNASRCKVRQTVQNNVRMYQDLGYEIIDQELVVRETGSVKALTLEKSLRPQ